MQLVKRVLVASVQNYRKHKTLIQEAAAVVVCAFGNSPPEAAVNCTLAVLLMEFVKAYCESYLCTSGMEMVLEHWAALDDHQSCSLCHFL